MCHPLNLVNTARPLIIPIDLISFIGMSFRIAAHEVGNLHPPYRFAWRILTGNQVDGLCLPPRICLCDDVLYVTDIYWHVFCCLLKSNFVGLKYVVSIPARRKGDNGGRA